METRFSPVRGENGRCYVRDDITGHQEEVPNYEQAVIIAMEKSGIKMYESLNDAAVLHPELQHGKTKIWYFGVGQGRDFMMGGRFLKSIGKFPTRETLEKTHKLLGEIATDDLNTIYHVMQAQYWSPRAEARRLIGQKGLEHTSMCVGDVIEANGKLYLIDNFGFTEFN